MQQVFIEFEESEDDPTAVEIKKNEHCHDKWTHSIVHLDTFLARHTNNADNSTGEAQASCKVLPTQNKQL